MTERPEKPVVLTGASGMLGRELARALAAEGWELRLTDIADFPDPVPQNATFTKIDLSQARPLLDLAAGCGAIVHFGGISRDRSYEEVFGPNLDALYYVYEAARRERARVVFASSNHAFGFYERSATIDDDAPFMPDCYYGLSKAYGELMGRLYWSKHGVKNISLRIGTSIPTPVDARMLATWLSFGDLVRLAKRCVLSDAVTCDVIWGASKNRRMTWWGKDARQKIGWEPLDSADAFEAELAEKVSTDPIAERYMGGAYCAADYSNEKC
jgi:uronate dehydrogenase